MSRWKDLRVNQDNRDGRGGRGQGGEDRRGAPRRDESGRPSGARRSGDGRSVGGARRDETAERGRGGRDAAYGAQRASGERRDRSGRSARGDGGERGDRPRGDHPDRTGGDRREGPPPDGDRGARGLGPRLVPTKRRLPEPAIAEGVTGAELDRDVRGQLRTLSKENADGVAQHLVMVALLLQAEDLDGALAHAETAVRRAGRVPAAREALGMVAYRLGDFARALAEFRTVRRLSGSDHLLPLMVDCERGLGRPERALELANSPEAANLTAAERVELAIVISGIRRDLGQLDAAVLGLERGIGGPVRPWSARLYYAYADALAARGDDASARTWFGKVVEQDHDLETDAAERLDELDGLVFTDLDDDVDEDGGAQA